MYTYQKNNVQKVLGLIPDDLLITLSMDTKVDYCAKVLYGERIFNLLSYGILTTDRTSQRTLEDLFKTDLFKAMFCYDEGMKISHNSISTRLPAPPDMPSGVTVWEFAIPFPKSF
jgi:hypothetical protein